MIRQVLVASSLMFSSLAFSTILPPNDLYLEDNLFGSDMTEEQFLTITNSVIDVYKPLAKTHGANLTVNARWNDSTVNASAQQTGKSWIVNMYGGLARRPEVTADGYVMVICHELGHHFAGFPFVSAWAANEGQSDYFATQACAQKLWAADLEVNATFRETVELPAKELCDQNYSTEEAQNLCYRAAMAGKSLATLLGALGGGAALPDFSTPDTTEVSRTNGRHPAAQCRLDTYTAGALCTVDFNETIIPGKNNGRSTREAEVEAYTYSCATRDGYTQSVRPRCWFKGSDF